MLFDQLTFWTSSGDIIRNQKLFLWLKNEKVASLWISSSLDIEQTETSSNNQFIIYDQMVVSKFDLISS